VALAIGPGVAFQVGIRSICSIRGSNGGALWVGASSPLKAATARATAATDATTTADHPMMMPRRPGRRPVAGGRVASRLVLSLVPVRVSVLVDMCFLRLGCRGGSAW
jgi:hypothetical protein